MADVIWIEIPRELDDRVWQRYLACPPPLGHTAESYRDRARHFAAVEAEVLELLAALRTGDSWALKMLVCRSALEARESADKWAAASRRKLDEVELGARVADALKAGSR